MHCISPYFRFGGAGGGEGLFGTDLFESCLGLLDGVGFGEGGCFFGGVGRSFDINILLN